MAERSTVFMSGVVDYWIQYALLRVDPVWRRNNICQKIHVPVFVIPGFLAGDWVMLLLTRWLRRQKCKVHTSHLLVNAGCQERVLNFLYRELARTYEKNGKVVVIGHSLGGIQGVVLAHYFPEMVRHIITIGSPLQQLPTDIHPFVASLFEFFKHAVKGGRCEPCFNEKGCLRFRIAQKPFAEHIGMTAIFSRNDRVLNPAIAQSSFADNREVTGGHLGLVANREVYEVIAEVLGSLT